MTLDISQHKTILFQILKDIYTDKQISPFLGFKGGTAALLFYNLDRFSVDLDFDLLDSTQQDLVYECLGNILKKYGDLKDRRQKRFNIFFLLSYEENSHKIKIEVNKRQFKSSYELKTYLGVSMKVMKIEDMFAHKLMAMWERAGKTNRDIYDVWFFLNNRFLINKKIVEQRSGKDFSQTIKDCVSLLDAIDKKNILNGIGELLDDSRRLWVKNNLINETISLLKVRFE